MWEEKNAILSDSSADLYSHGCQHEHKGLVGESKVRLTYSLVVGKPLIIGHSVFEH